MAKIRILIVEDELLIAEDIRMQLIIMGYEVSDIATSYNEAIESIMRDLPDLAMVDINIDGPRDGIELGAFLRNEAEIPFIYLTSHSDQKTVQRAKETKPDAYLLKPFKGESLYTSIEIALASASGKVTGNEQKPDDVQDIVLKEFFFVKKEHTYYKVRISDIDYIKSDGNYLELFENSKKHVFRHSMKSIMDQLPPYFFQSSRSFIINLNNIESFSVDKVVVKGTDIPLSKGKKEELMAKMNTFS